MEIRVGLVEDNLAFVGVPANGEGLPDWPSGSVFEISPASLTQGAVLADRVARTGGSALVMDYGERHSGRASLRAYRKHAECHPLHFPGDADLTADVNFSALAGAITKAGANTHGPVTQAAFLKSMGIEQRIQTLVGLHPDKAESLYAACHRLTDPSEMGTAYKAMAVTPPGMPTPAGFECIS